MARLPDAKKVDGQNKEIILMLCPINSVKYFIINNL